MTIIKDIDKRFIPEYEKRLKDAVELKKDIRKSLKGYKLLKEVSVRMDYLGEATMRECFRQLGMDLTFDKAFDIRESLRKFGQSLSLIKNKTSLYTHILNSLKDREVKLYKKTDKYHKAERINVYATIKYNQPKYIFDKNGEILEIIGEDKGYLYTNDFDFKWYSPATKLELIEKGSVIPKNLILDDYIYDSIEEIGNSQDPKIIKKLNKIEKKFEKKKAKLEKKLKKLKIKRDEVLKGNYV